MRFVVEGPVDEQTVAAIAAALRAHRSALQTPKKPPRRQSPWKLAMRHDLLAPFSRWDALDPSEQPRMTVSERWMSGERETGV